MTSVVHTLLHLLKIKLKPFTFYAEYAADLTKFTTHSCIYIGA